MNMLIEQINSMGRAFADFAVPMLMQSSVLIVILLIVDLIIRRKVQGGVSVLHLDAGIGETDFADDAVIACKPGVFVTNGISCLADKRNCKQRRYSNGFTRKDRTKNFCADKCACCAACTEGYCANASAIAGDD